MKMYKLLFKYLLLIGFFSTVSCTEKDEVTEGDIEINAEAKELRSRGGNTPAEA